ncbi:MAG: PRC-barrel domain-containing protein, partial [Gemmatimonadota bacterium]
LIGYSVVRMNGEPVGVVSTVYEAGEQMLLGLEADGREFLVPFGSQVVTEVDREARQITIDPPPGLLEV